MKMAFQKWNEITPFQLHCLPFTGEYQPWFSGKVQDFPSCFHLALNLLAIIIACSGNINNNFSANNSQCGCSSLFVSRNKLAGSGVSVSPENLLQKFKSFLKKICLSHWFEVLWLHKTKNQQPCQAEADGNVWENTRQIAFFKGFFPPLDGAKRKKRINNKIANHPESNKPLNRSVGRSFVLWEIWVPTKVS